MKKRTRNRFLALLLTLALLLPCWPETVLATSSYGRTVGKNVLVYKEASPDYGAWFYAEQGTPGMVLIKQAGQGGTYYKVQMYDPYAVTPTIVVGFILESQFTLMTDAEAAAFEAAGGLANPAANAITAQTAAAAQPVITAQPAATAYSAGAQSAAAVTTTGVITRSGVNFRSGPSKRDSVHMQLDRGTEVEVLSIPAANDADPWYRVRYSGIIGYIQGPFLQVTGAVPSSGTAGAVVTAVPAMTAAPAATAAPAQAASPAATAVPAAQTAQTASSASYAKLLLSSTDLRSKPNGDVRTQWTGIGSTLPVLGPATMYEGYAWYPVQMNGAIYYVRGDSVQLTSVASAASVGTPVPAAVVTAVPQTAAGTAAAQDAQTVAGALGYVKTTKGGVNLRLQPNGGTISQVSRNQVLPYLAAPVTESNYQWYYVQVGNLRGYLRGDCVALCAADGTLLPAQTAVVIPATAAPVQTAVATLQPGAQPTLTPVNAAYLRTTVSNVNLRVSPGGGTVETVKKNVVLPLVGQPVVSGRYTWYPVRSTTGRTGWLRGDCIALTDANGYELPASATVIPITTPIAAAVTPAPTAVNVAYGYLQVTKSKVNVRKTPAGATVSQVDKGTVWPIAGAVTTASGYNWYPVRINSQTVYLRGDCVQVMSETQTAAYLAGQKIPVETVTPAPQTATSLLAVQATAKTVNIRRSASQDSQSLAQVSAGTVLIYTATTTAGGRSWYNVTYGSVRGWVLGTSVRVITETEYNAIVAANATSAAAAEAASGSAAAGNLAYAGYVKTIKGGVNIRKTAGGLSMGTIARGIVLTYTQTTTKGSYTWYKVNTSLGVGWVRSDCVELSMADGSAYTAEPAGNTTATGQTVNTVVMEASYTVLKLGSSGSAVSRLISALRQQGYYNGTSTASYTTDVQEAVVAFQRAKGLSADGIAGSNTQHALYGTVPKGSANSTSDMSMVIYPAEKIDWFKGGIQEMWPRGANAKIYDVKTGIVWWAHRWAGANHADIEPLSASDTARLCQIYGVSKASDIASKNLWQRRPCLITIGTHTYACSLYGVPHNYGAGDISNNNMNGQICLHFTNSKTHTSKKVDSYHKAAIEYAWQNAPNGHK